MGMNEIAALRAAAQALIDEVEADERLSGGLLSRLTLKRCAELRRLLVESRVEALITERAERRELRPV
jgi:hypothetical protein